jgi:hypothetical protein
MLMHDGFKFTEVKMDRYEAVNDIYRLSDTKLLLVRENTLVEFDYKKWTFDIKYRSSTKKNELFFGSLLVDNFIFLGTSHGLQKWDISKKTMAYLTAEFPIAVSTRSRSLSYNQKEKEVIFGVRDGLIVYKKGNKQASVL